MEKKNNNNILKIYKFGEEILKQRASELTEIDGKTVDLINAMFATMYKSRNAIGLAAPQVGESLRISVIDISQGQKEDDRIILLNPEILEAEGKDSLEEGCLSFPGISIPINRSTRILLKNITLDGKETRHEIEGYLARVIQHEIDHLDGTLIIDRISSLKRQFVKKEIKRLQEEGDW